MMKSVDKTKCSLECVWHVYHTVHRSIHLSEAILWLHLRFRAVHAGAPWHWRPSRKKWGRSQSSLGNNFIHVFLES